MSDNNSKEIENLRKQFEMIDKDNSGMIEVSELTEILKEKKFNM